MYDLTYTQNAKMSDQIVLLMEKLEFFISHIKKEQAKGPKRGEYFTHKEEEFKGKLTFANVHNIAKDIELGQIFKKMKRTKNKIAIMRKQLRLSYGIDKITELENDKKLKIKQYNKLTKDNDKLK